mmetsp:Transcript_26167/g.37534  ORF Transcript_26167/g.37534 Transcript_26167/m.37534 type:complete len:153 (+) Transcript_26167:195-653(+)
MSNNIFLTSENLAFAMPLILICIVYAYFKLIPLKIGVTLLVVLAGFLKVRSDNKIRRAEKALVEVVDDAMIQELAKDELEKSLKSKKAAAKKQQKADEALRQRLKNEKKVENQQKQQSKSSKRSSKEDEDDDDVNALLTFAKGSRAQQSKKK